MGLENIMFSEILKKKKVNPPKILVVDDEPNILTLVCKFLRYKNYEVIIAVNGKEGLEKAMNENPDLILLDTGMPVMDGYEMLDRLRKCSDTKDMPVIMLTAFCEPDNIATASSYGVIDYITKPFEHALLHKKIVQALESKHKQKAAHT